MSAAAEVVRRSCGGFALADRAVIEVSGSDRVRWLQGMVSNDVAALADGSDGSGCYALLLTPQGRIVADLHVLRRGEHFWLELALAAREDTWKRLDAFIIADDVALRDVGDAWQRFALEGARGAQLLAAWTGERVALERHGGATLSTPVGEVFVARWSVCGDDGHQLFVPSGSLSQVASSLAEAARTAGIDWVDGDRALLEQLRIEAGVPGFGSELGPDVLPAEVDLVGEAVSLEKGCYTGQEVVARMASRGAASHRLVALRFAEADVLPAVGSPLCAGDKTVGELTSITRSSDGGVIGLGFLRRAQAEAGGEFDVAGTTATPIPRPGRSEHA